MQTCKEYKAWVWLSVYDELDSNKQDELDAHLKSCTSCSDELREAEKVFQLLNKKQAFTPGQDELEKNRQVLHTNLLRLRYTQSRVRSLATAVWNLLSLNFNPPALRFGTAAALTIIGLIIGQWMAGPRQISPGSPGADVADINYVNYEPETGRVTIGYNSVEENRIQGDMQKPEIQRMLTYALLNENRPNVRLKTVGALSFIEEMDINLIKTVIDVMQNDDNPGVRLKAIKILNAIPINQDVRNLFIEVFTKMMLKEENTAIRNEAINGLSRIGNLEIVPFLYSISETDTSEYFRYKASQHLDKVKIERKH